MQRNRPGIRPLPAALAALALAGPAAAQAPADELPVDTPRYVRTAVENEQRPAEDRARDVTRKPAVILAMSGVSPGDHVIESTSCSTSSTTTIYARTTSTRPC